MKRLESASSRASGRGRLTRRAQGSITGSTGATVVDHTSPVSDLLRAWGQGDAQARDDLLPLVYAELRAQAVRYMRRERRDHTLQPTALVHEAYMRLIGQARVSWQNRAHFFGLAAEMMRRILVDHARKHQAAKRSGAAMRVAWDEQGRRNAAAGL